MMAKHSYEKARWNFKQARQRIRANGWNRWYKGCTIYSRPEEGDRWLLEVRQQQKRLSRSVNRHQGRYTRRLRKLWRRQGHQQERLHLLELHDEAQELDPQPRRLGVMWDIW